MRQRTRAKKNPPARVARVPWRVVKVRALPKHQLWVRFADGLEGKVDVAPMIFGKNPGVFRKLRDEARFAEVSVDAGAVTWPGELDLAPDAMYDEIKANGHWTLEPFPAT
jgi:hypothetical protein